AISMVALTIALFCQYFFDLKKVKKQFIYLSYLVLFVLPIIAGVLTILYTRNITAAYLIVIIPALAFGIMFWSYYSYLIFSSGIHKQKWKLYIYICATIYSFCYFAYPFLALLNIDETDQVLAATTGALIMLLATAYLLTKNFNKEHKDLIQLKKIWRKRSRNRRTSTHPTSPPPSPTSGGAGTSPSRG
ncbi:MAG: hypothetical protein P8107_09675, partial [Spirochaetia bacterium]